MAGVKCSAEFYAAIGLLRAEFYVAVARRCAEFNAADAEFFFFFFRNPLFLVCYLSSFD